MSAIVRADALSLPLGDETVDLVVTSPPYFALRSYQDGGEHYDGQIGSEATPQQFLEALWAVMGECWRVLKPSGSVWVNLGDKYSQRVATRQSSHQDGLQPDREGVAKDWNRDRELGLARMPSQNVMACGKAVREKSLMGLPWRFAIGCIDGEADPDGKGWILRAEVVWSKPNGLPESVTDRVRRSHEQWFCFTKEPRYFCDIDPIREAHIGGQSGQAATFARANPSHDLVPGQGYTQHRPDRPGTPAANPLGKLPDSVWTIATQPLIVPDHLGIDHFAAFPTEFPRRIITAWSPSGICTVCGEGRRSVSEKTASKPPRGQSETDRFQRDRTSISGGEPSAFGVTRTITGEACACADTSAPTRPAVVLDPFGGSGTTAEACIVEGFGCVLIEKDEAHVRLIEQRLAKPIAPSLFGAAS